MRFFRSLRGQLALIIIIALLIPASVIGYYGVVFELAEKNMAADAEKQLNSAGAELIPLFNELSGRAKEEEIVRLGDQVNGIVRNYPGLKVSFYNGSLLYAFRDTLHPKSREDILTVSIPSAAQRVEFDSALREPPAGVTLREGSLPGPPLVQRLLSVGTDPKGLLVLENRLGVFFLQSRSARQVTGLALLAGFLFGVLGVFWTSYSIRRRIAKIQAGLARVVKDLNSPLEPQSGELGVVVESINRMRKELVEKRKLEEQLQRAERLAGLGQLVAGVAHEIRNPLGIIKGTVQIMERDVKAEPGLAKYSEHLQVLKEQINRQNRVVEELLSYARPAKAQFGPVSIFELVESVLTFLGPSLRQQGISLSTNIPRELPRVLGDGEKLKQVLVNLLLNSREALPRGGEVTITAASGDKHVLLSVSDNGEGIASEHLSRIWEPFFSTKETGTGLGLAIVRQLVDLHQGKLEVKSKPGAGSTFIIQIPLWGERDADNPHNR